MDNNPFFFPVICDLKCLNEQHRYLCRVYLPGFVITPENIRLHAAVSKKKTEEKCCDGNG